jgi:alpha-L-arabinofuranosidase
MAAGLSVKSPGYDAEVADNVPYLDISAVHDEDGRTLTFFAVNRHGGEDIDLDVSLLGFGAAAMADHRVMTSQDLEAVNSLKAPLSVTPRKGSHAAVADGVLTAKLPPHSYQMICLGLS